jgi:putative sterol carrier protein
MAILTYEKIFSDVKKSLMKADVSKLSREFAIQCNIQGEGEGAFYIAFKEGIFSVEPYDYKDSNANLFASGDTFMKMFAKKLCGKEAFEKGLLGFDGDVEVVLMLGSLEAKVSAPAKKAPAKKTAAKPAAAKKPATKPAVKTDDKPLAKTAVEKAPEEKK